MRGSIVKRGRGYSYVLYLGRDESGRKRQKWVGGFRTKKDAEVALAEALGRVHTGTFTDPGGLTVGQYLEQWLDGIAPSIREKTAASYADLLRGHAIPRVGRLRLGDLTAPRVGQLYAELQTSGSRRGTGGLSARTVAYVHRVLSHALKDAVQAGLIARNPAAFVRAPRAPKPDTETWSAEDVSAFLRSVEHDRLYALWALLATTGMRRGEALGLKWDDVDLDECRVMIRRGLVLAGAKVLESAPKSAAGARLVVLHPKTRDALRVHRTQQLEERMAAGPDWEAGSYVFTTEIGHYLYPDRVTKQFGKHVEEAGLPRIRLHDLRHTVATLALTAGVHAKIVQELLGHSSITVTLDTYSHVTPGIHEKAALAIGALIYGVDEPIEPQRSPRPRRASARHASQRLSLEEE
jgi:integrase